MTTWNRNSKVNFEGYRVWSIFILLFLYILSLQISTLHDFVHDDNHDVALHSPQQEKNPCHRSIYHDDKSACKHKSHITSSEKCLLCHLSVGQDHCSETTPAEEFVDATLPLNTFTTESFVAAFSIHLSSRAPPVS